jgi:ATP-binding protein involved in chromosome partitioning
MINEELKLKLKKLINVDVELTEHKGVVTLTTDLLNKKLIDLNKKEIARLIKHEFKYPGLSFIYTDNSTDTRQSKYNPVYIAVESGKGGVGKSTVCANLAYALATLGYKVGIIDCDVYGPTIPLIFEIEDRELSGDDKKIYPTKCENISIVSTAFLVEKNKPILWRAPMLHKLLNSFFVDVSFDKDLDFMLIDMPPGTGDVAIDLKSFAPDVNVLIVTTNDKVAPKIALKAGLGARELGLNVLGVVENMTYIENNLDYEIFGKNSSYIHEALNVPLLGSIPFIPGGGLIKDKRAIYYVILAERIISLCL